MYLAEVINCDSIRMIILTETLMYFCYFCHWGYAFTLARLLAGLLAGLLKELWTIFWLVKRADFCEYLHPYLWIVCWIRGKIIRTVECYVPQILAVVIW